MALGDATGQVQPDLARPGFFDFHLNGLATSKQMDRLIELTGSMAKRLVKNKDTPEGKAEAERIRALSEGTEAAKKATDQTDDLAKATKNLSGDFDALSRVATGSFKGLQDLSYFLDNGSKLALGLTGFSTMLGALNGYADNLGKAMQMGVGGDIMTFALASKTAGLQLESFTKALSETGGGFASLSGNATDGAISFGKLINQVRSGTEQFGNLGLSLDELSVYTAQQVKTVVSQGFKGKQAQEQVRKNSVALARDLESLSSSTGKSVVELAAAANKLATDPLIATMVATTRESREQVSKAVNGFAASVRGIFGEAGDVLGTDALKSAAAGLPLALTEAGKNLLIASAPLYNEFSRLAQGVQEGREVTEADRDRLRSLAEQEIQTRGQQIKTMSMLEGPAGDAAKQILKLAEEARFYNTAEGKERKKELDASRKFVAERNKLQASLQQAMLPVLELLNTIDWNLFYNVLNGTVQVFSAMLNVLNPITSLLSATGAGSLIGGLLALAGVVSIAKAAFAAFTGLRAAAGGMFGGGAAAGGMSGMFSRRANGQTAATPLWIRSADFKSSMPRGDGRNIAAYRAGRFAGRNRGALLGGALGIGALGAGSLMSGIGDDMGIGNLAGSIFDSAGYLGLAGTLMSTRAGRRGIAGLAGAARPAGSMASAAVKASPYALAGGLGSAGIASALGAGDSTAGTIGNVAGSLGGAALGRIMGGAFGTALGGPVGTFIGATIGGVAGQVLGDTLFGDKIKDTAMGANDEIYNSKVKQAEETSKMQSTLAELADYQRAANSINAQSLVYQRDTSRTIKNIPPVQ
jgi:hypothetical protein